MSLLNRFKRYFFGYDFFLSYSRSDCTEYTANLAKKIIQSGYSCFIDQWGSDPGKELPKKLKNKIKNSSIFVLIGSDGATQSHAISQEIDLFLKTKRVIIPIDFGKVKSAIWFNKIEGIALSEESTTAIETNMPSTDVLERCINAFTYVRQSKRIRNSTLLAFLLIAGIVLSAKIILDNKDKLEVAKDRQEMAAYWEIAESENTAESYISYLTNAKIQTDSIHIKKAISKLGSRLTSGLEGWLFIGQLDEEGNYKSEFANVYWRANASNNIEKSQPQPGDIVNLMIARTRITYRTKDINSGFRNEFGWRPNTKAFVKDVIVDGKEVIVQIIYY